MELVPDARFARLIQSRARFVAIRNNHASKRPSCLYRPIIRTTRTKTSCASSSASSRRQVRQYSISYSRAEDSSMVTSNAAGSRRCTRRISVSQCSLVAGRSGVLRCLTGSKSGNGCHCVSFPHAIIDRLPRRPAPTPELWETSNRPVTTLRFLGRKPSGRLEAAGNFRAGLSDCPKRVYCVVLPNGAAGRRGGRFRRK